MDQAICARVAAIVGSAALQKVVSAIYDYSAAGHRNVAADARTGSISGYDYSTSSHFSGTGTSTPGGIRGGISGGVSGSFDIYDYQRSAHVSFRLDNSVFSGYDYSTSSHFSGSVNASAIWIYDNATGKHYIYSV